MNLLLTGATGFVGRNFLLQAQSRFDGITAPVRSTEKLYRQLESEGVSPEKILSLPVDPTQWPAVSPTHAVLSAGTFFARNRDEYFTTNVDWIASLVAALPDTCRIIILSSQSAGGPTPRGKTRRSEADRDTPLTWYGESKVAMEQMIRDRFSHRPITILRPPMVLGARDSATLPLFRMARQFFRIKPGWRAKSYSFIAVNDLVDAIFSALSSDQLGLGPYYVSSDEIISDTSLIATAASVSRGRGITIPVPQLSVRLIAAAVDAIPPLREKNPSLTRDRAREIWPDRWMVDSSAFQSATSWRPQSSLQPTLQAAYDWYVKTRQL